MDKALYHRRVGEKGTHAEVVVVNARLRVPYSALAFQFSRASGPGGQHVNRAESAVELTFAVAQSPWLTEAERERIRKKLANHIDKDGVLHVVAQSERSQLRNRAEAIAKFAALLRGALHVPKKRTPTKLSQATKYQRRERKQRDSRIKQTRRKVSVDE